eukprot:12948633-Alexandrium_andersonii.AAC.1
MPGAARAWRGIAGPPQQSFRAISLSFRCASPSSSSVLWGTSLAREESSRRWRPGLAAGAGQYA